jgi:hypothetical protein
MRYLGVPTSSFLRRRRAIRFTSCSLLSLTLGCTQWPTHPRSNNVDYYVIIMTYNLAKIVCLIEIVK